MDNEGMTPLNEACSSNSPKQFKLLLDHGADVSLGKNHLHEIVCWRFSERRYLKILMLVLRTIKDRKTLDGMNSDGNSPLSVACMRADYETCEILLKAGASLERKYTYSIHKFKCCFASNCRCSYLHLATRLMDIDLLKLFLAYDSEVFFSITRDIYSQTPLELAKSLGWAEGAQILSDYEKAQNTHKLYPICSRGIKRRKIESN